MFRNKAVALVLLFSFTTFSFAPLAQAATYKLSNGETLDITPVELPRAPGKLSILEWGWDVPAGSLGGGNIWVSRQFVERGSYAMDPNRPERLCYDNNLSGINWAKYPTIDLFSVPNTPLINRFTNVPYYGITSGVGYVIPYADLMAADPGLGTCSPFPGRAPMEWTWDSVPAGSLGNGDAWVSQEFVQKGFSAPNGEYNFDPTLLNVDWSKYPIVDFGYNPFPQYGGITSGVGYKIPQADLMVINPNFGILRTYDPSKNGFNRSSPLGGIEGIAQVDGRNVYLIDGSGEHLAYADGTGVHEKTTTITVSGGGGGLFGGGFFSSLLTIASIGLAFVGIPAVAVTLSEATASFVAAAKTTMSVVGIASSVVSGNIGIDTALSAMGFTGIPSVVPSEIIQAGGIVNTVVKVAKNGLDPVTVLNFIGGVTGNPTLEDVMDSYEDDLLVYDDFPSPEEVADISGEITTGYPISQEEANENVEVTPLAYAEDVIGTPLDSEGMGQIESVFGSVAQSPTETGQNVSSAELAPITSEAELRKLVAELDFNNPEAVAAARNRIKDYVRFDEERLAADTRTSSEINTSVEQGMKKFDAMVLSKQAEAQEAIELVTNTNMTIARTLIYYESKSKVPISESIIKDIAEAKNNLEVAYSYHYRSASATGESINAMNAAGERVKAAEAALDEAISADPVAAVMKENMLRNNEQQKTRATAIADAVDAVSRGTSSSRETDPAVYADAVAKRVVSAGVPPGISMVDGLMAGVKSGAGSDEIHIAMARNLDLQNAQIALNKAIDELFATSESPLNVSSGPAPIGVKNNESSGNFVNTYLRISNRVLTQQNAEELAFRRANPAYARAKAEYDAAYNQAYLTATGELMTRLVPVVASAVSEATGIPLERILSPVENLNLDLKTDNVCNTYPNACQEQTNESNKSSYINSILPAPVTSRASAELTISTNPLQNMAPSPTEAAMRVPVQLGEAAYGVVADAVSNIRGALNTNTAPAGKVLPSGTPSDVSASCNPLFNTPCESAAVNSCGQRGRAVYDCAGNCLALPPPDSSCPLPTTCQDPAATNFEGSLPCAFPPITVTERLQARPLLLHVGETARISWGVSNASSCTVTGTNGDGTAAGPAGVWNTLSSGTAGRTSSPIQGQTTYTLLCSSLPGATPASFSESETVNIIPSYRE